MAIRPGRLLVPATDSAPDVQWTATGVTGILQAEIHLHDEGGGEFSVRAGFRDRGEIVIRQRTFKIHPDEYLNSIGLLAKAIERLGEEE